MVVVPTGSVKSLTAEHAGKGKIKLTAQISDTSVSAGEISLSAIKRGLKSRMPVTFFESTVLPHMKKERRVGVHFCFATANGSLDVLVTKADLKHALARL